MEAAVRQLRSPFHLFPPRPRSSRRRCKRAEVRVEAHPSALKAVLRRRARARFAEPQLRAPRTCSTRWAIKSAPSPTRSSRCWSRWSITPLDSDPEKPELLQQHGRSARGEGALSPLSRTRARRAHLRGRSAPARPPKRLAAARRSSRPRKKSEQASVVESVKQSSADRQWPLFRLQENGRGVIRPGAALTTSQKKMKPPARLLEAADQGPSHVAVCARRPAGVRRRRFRAARPGSGARFL